MRATTRFAPLFGLVGADLRGVLAQKGADADETTRHESCQAVYLRGMPTPKKVPVHKRYPNQWCAKSVIYTPKTRIEIEGPLSNEVGELVLALFTCVKQVQKPENVEAIKALTQALTAK